MRNSPNTNKNQGANIAPWFMLYPKAYFINAFTDIGRSAGAAAIAFPVASGDSPGHSDGSPVSRHATGGHPRPRPRVIAVGWHEDG